MSRTACDPQLIKSVLKSLDSLDQLKKLFCYMNYEVREELIPFRYWSETARSVIADEPHLIAKGGDDPTYPFKIIYIRLNSKSLPAENERVVICQLQGACLYGLFVFSNKTKTHWHFINVITDVQHPNKQIFRRLSVGPEEQKFDRLRTATEILTKLDLDEILRKQGSLQPLFIQKGHDDAFDVRSIRDGFYEEYERVFTAVEPSITGISGEQKRLFTQRLFNRLMFIALVRKKVG